MVDQQQFLNAMRNVANSVTVVTTDGPAGHHGATVSAFNSVSADPPLVLVCLNASSKINQLVLQNRSFTVTVLADDCSHIADRFAGRHDKQISHRFEGLELKGGALQIESAAAFDCKIESSIMSGSHHIVIGDVVACRSGASNPLAYLDGSYHHVCKFPAAEQ